MVGGKGGQTRRRLRIKGVFLENKMYAYDIICIHNMLDFLL
jgi:hypothetical protein